MSAARPTARRGPRGSAYLLVLMSAMLVTVIGLSAVALERVRTRSSHREADWTHAQALASSAVEHAMKTVSDLAAVDPDWRETMLAAGTDTQPPLELGGGTIAWSLQRAKGSRMSDDPDKRVYVVGTGEKGEARHVLRAVLRPAGLAFSCLTVPMHCRDDMVFESGAVVQADGIIHAGDDVVSSGASVFTSEVHAHGQIHGSTYYGITVAAAPHLGIPDDDDVTRHWKGEGVKIDADAHLPLSGGERVLENVVLSPGVNPFGDEDPEGVYVLESDTDLRIRNVRVLGTLVLHLRDVAERATLSGSVSLTPAVAGHPALICTDRLSLALSSSDLSEAAQGVNFNPPGTPYLGEDDETLDDVYPSVLRGLVYAAKNIDVQAGYTRLEGILVGEDKIRVESAAILELTYQPSISEDPPAEFFIPDGNVRIAPFTWARVVDE